MCPFISFYKITAKPRCCIENIFNKLSGFPIILATIVIDMKADVGILFYKKRHCNLAPNLLNVVLIFSLFLFEVLKHNAKLTWYWWKEYNSVAGNTF